MCHCAGTDKTFLSALEKRSQKPVWGSETTIAARTPSSYYEDLHQHSQDLTSAFFGWLVGLRQLRVTDKQAWKSTNPARIAPVFRNASGNHSFKSRSRTMFNARRIHTVNKRLGKVIKRARGLAPKGSSSTTSDLSLRRHASPEVAGEHHARSASAAGEPQRNGRSLNRRSARKRASLRKRRRTTLTGGWQLL